MKKIHYSWVIALACLLELVFTQGLVCNTFGVFVVPICEEFGCSRSSVAICQTMFLVSGMAVSLDRKSTRLNSSHPTTSRMPSSA